MAIKAAVYATSDTNIMQLDLNIRCQDQIIVACCYSRTDLSSFYSPHLLLKEFIDVKKHSTVQGRKPSSDHRFTCEEIIEQLKCSFVETKEEMVVLTSGQVKAVVVLMRHNGPCLVRDMSV